jgi:translation initiation factor IF-2
MPDTNKKENPLRNAGMIAEFSANKTERIRKLLEDRKKRAEDALKRLSARKDALTAEMQAKIEKQLEKEKLGKEREEAVKEAISAPILESSATEELPAATEEPAPAPVPVEPVKAETPPAPSVQKEAAPVQKKPEEKKGDQKKKPDAASIISGILEKPKKPAIEKPVIRIYIPPEDTRPPRRREGAPGSSGKGPGPRTIGGKPIPRITSAPSLTTLQKDLKKKTDKGKAKEAPSEKKSMSRKTLIRKGFDVDTSSVIEYDEISGEIKKVRSRKTGLKKSAAFIQPQTTVIDHAVLNKSTFTIKELSEKIGKTGAEIIKQLFLLNIIKTINDTLDFETAELVSGELGVSLELKQIATSEEKMLSYHGEEEDDKDKLVQRPPIVTIMGHVDHGKTSLLDYIRNTSVAAGEAGGITQHIGAYTITAGGSQVTFLDTPGHEAFTAMRARGANVTDIAIIVIAADDGIMPQTIEAINHAKAAKVAIIVALNKMDKPGVDPDKALNQLTEQGLVPEEWGGTVPVVRVSAKTGMGVDSLLDTILITAEVLELKANPDRKARGAIIEASLDKGKGPVATVLVQNGTLKLSDYVVAGSVTGKIRAMQDHRGKAVVKATPSMAVSVLGFHDVPSAGDMIMVVADEKQMKEVVEERLKREQESRAASAKVSLDDVFKGIAEGEKKSLNVIIKADAQGSVEAIRDSLLKLSTDEVKVSVVHAVAGAINESDVMLADTTKSFIIGFNVRPDSNARALADKSGIDIRLYRIIYDAIDDVQKAINGLTAPKYREQYLGRAEVRALYKISGVGTIAGCMVKDGKIVRNAKVRLLRDNIVVADTLISSLKRLKDDVKEVSSGFECGIGLNGYNDVKVGDVIESFETVEQAK